MIMQQLIHKETAFEVVANHRISWGDHLLVVTSEGQTYMTVPVGLKPHDSKVHFCIVCDYPVAVYGRIWPCLHTFCLTCASTAKTCTLCNSEVLRVERVTREQGLYISPVSLQSFKSEEDLQSHAEEVRIRLASVGS